MKYMLGSEEIGMSSQDIRTDSFEEELKDTPLDRYIYAQLSQDSYTPVGEMEAQRALGKLSLSIRADRSRRISGLSHWLSYGAAFALVVFVGFKLLSPIAEHRGQAAAQIYKTNAGQRASVTLSDGSAVTLAPLTTLKVMNRTIELNGEAVFTVTNNKGDPFIVNTRNVAVRVLGTTFGVRAYSSEAGVDVLVAEGRVALSKGQILTMGDVSSVADDGSVTVKRGDVVSLLSWTQGRHVYQGVPLDQFARDIERWYGIRITITDPALAQRPITTDFMQRPAHEILSMLARTLDVQYHQNGNNVTLSPR